MNNNYKNIFRCKELVPVISLSDKKFALDLSELLVSKGVMSIEITLREKNAIECISYIAKHSNINIGAGTILSIEDAKRSLDAGANFLVSPGLNVKIANNFSNYIPGVFTATEVQDAISLGINFLKFFPANENYNIIKNFKGPFSSVSFMPTGGINKDTYKTWLELDNVDAVGGSWMIDKISVENKNLGNIERILDESLS